MIRNLKTDIETTMNTDVLDKKYGELIVEKIEEVK